MSEQAPQSYVNLCRIIYARPQDKMLFCYANGQHLAYLDRYTITPNEEYDELVEALRLMVRHPQAQFMADVLGDVTVPDDSPIAVVRRALSKHVLQHAAAAQTREG